MGVLLDRDVTQVRGIPVASAALIIVQMSSKLGLRDLGRLTDDALRLGLTSLREIRTLSARLGRAPGRSPRNVELMLQERTAEHEALESVLENFVFDALRRFDVPAPVAQYEIFVDGHRRRIDLSYPEKMVALEAKGFAYHDTRSRFRRGRPADQRSAIGRVDRPRVHLRVHRSSDRAAGCPGVATSASAREAGALVRGMEGSTLSV
jgi:hypothetical protein